MTDTASAALLKLVAEWRDRATSSERAYRLFSAKTFAFCADELSELLASLPAPAAPEEEKSILNAFSYREGES